MSVTIYKRARVPAALLQNPDCAPDAQGFVVVDLAVENGLFVPLPLEGAAEVVDLAGRITLPGLVDAHVHLDKTYIASRTGISRTGLEEAVGLAMGDVANRTVEDLRLRMERALRTAALHGTVAIRTHLDSMSPPSANPAWAVMAEMRDRWAHLLRLEAVALMRIERALEPSFADRCADIARFGGLAGGYIAAEGCPPDAVDAFLRHAQAAGLDVDFHVDESLDPQAIGIETVLDSLKRTEFTGRVTLGHCCALAAMPQPRALHLVGRMAKAGVHVISLPFSNLYLQDRQIGQTARHRGLTMVPELADAGVPVSFASDNVQDPFYPYGNYDLIEVLRVATLAAQLEDAPANWVQAITTRPAAIMGLQAQIAPGRPADMIVFDCDNWLDFFSKNHADRRVIRAGRPLDAASLPPALEA